MIESKPIGKAGAGIDFETDDPPSNRGGIPGGKVFSTGTHSLTVDFEWEFIVRLSVLIYFHHTPPSCQGMSSFT